ncbi:MAG: sypC, partial [Conexibacter sp.]|nr:sypC [Conexibacter sp.]
RVKARALGAQQHQDIPFEQVVELAQPVRSLAHTPLFQVMFAWQNMPQEGLALPGLTVERLRLVDGAAATTAKFDLTLDLREVRGEIVGGLQYATALVERPTIERHLGYLQRLLAGLVADPEQPAEALPLLGEAERQQVVEAWNATDAEYPSEACVHELFEQQVARTPDAVAVMYEAEQLSYAALNARANRLADHLRTQGVGLETRVALCLERSLELVVAELAVLKCGAAYVPLDPSLPTERLAFVLADCGARVGISLVSDIPPALPGLLRWLTINASAEALSAEPLSRPKDPRLDRPERFSSELAAYVMYTSGSSGVPKGVVIPHHGITRLVLENGFTDLGPADRVAFASNPAFDASTFEVWAPLLTGGAVVVIAQETLLEPVRFEEALARYEITTLWVTVGLFNQYADLLAAAWGRLRYLLVGGDALDPQVIARVMARAARPKQLLNGYGPTETTTFATTHAIGAPMEETRSIPIGKPIGNTRVYVLDAHQQLVPVGVTGEVYIGGAGVARGYLNRPALTAERFVPDPFSKAWGRRLYRTGDLARWRPEGTLEFLGRNDDQVKVRGYRVELGEIEAVLAAHPAVESVAVVAREETPGDPRLVAYVVAEARPSNEAAATPETLRAFLAERLPAYMVPAAFVRLDALPLTANGKVDRKVLPAPDSTHLAVEAVFVEPRSDLERMVARIWCDLLNVSVVGVHDNFFELGGNSLLVVRAAARLQEVLKRPVRVVDLFQYPSVSALASQLSGVSTDADVIIEGENRSTIRRAAAARRRAARAEDAR